MAEVEAGVDTSSVDAALSALVSRVPEVEHVIVSNAFGLSIARVSADDASIDPLPAETALPIIFGKTVESADKLPFGRAKTVTLFTSNFVLAQANMAPLVLSVVAKPSVNVGLLTACLPAAVGLLEPLRAAAEAEMG